MESIILISKDSYRIKQEIELIAKKYNVGVFDKIVIEEEKSIGIEQVRNLQKNLFVSPIGGTIKIVILYSNDNITIQAQNALLKVLEEPPAHTLFILTGFTKETFLPTILSRCKIIELKDEKNDLSKKELQDREDILVYLQSETVGKKLQLAQNKGKSKEDALLFLEQMIILLRKNMLKRTLEHSQATNYQLLITQFQQAHTIIKTTNSSPRFALENLFLELI